MRAIVRGVLAAALLLPGVEVSAQSTETPIALSLPAQSLRDALNGLAGQTGLQIIYTADDVAPNLTAPRLEGSYTPAAALDTLLKNSGLTFEFLNSRTVAIGSGAVTTKAGWARTSKVSSSPAESNIVLARANGAEAASTSTESTPQPTALSDSDKTVRLEEVIVTGSHIRGAQNMSSPVIAFDRDAIEASGYATTQQLIQSLTQSLNSVSDTTTNHFNGGLAEGQGYDGAGVNLRGLGGDSTLVLLNGRRLAAAGKGSFVDVSLIPLSAIERVEVLTDGASAIYGSDAVGGAVNFVLRENFEGAETRLRYGSVTEGSHDETQVGQLLGHSWASGQVFLSYEYHDRTSLDASDRDFTPMDGSWSDLILIPKQRRKNALGLISQRLSDHIELSGELFYGERHSAWSRNMGMLPVDSQLESDVRQYGGSAGLTVDVARDWQVRFSGLLSQNDSEQRLYESQRPPEPNLGNGSRLWTMDLAADGPAFNAPGGDVRVAIGAQAREEEFVEESRSYPGKFEREILAAYAEVRIPWVSARNRRSGLERLELTLAGRYEDYSDFGSAFNPKLGLSWAPVAGLNVRGTWGTSFKAPLFSQMNPADTTVFVFDGFTDVSGDATGVIVNGSGVDLKPEESTNWTAGVDFVPRGNDRWKFSLTYFDIDYRHRINLPFPTGYYVPGGALLDPLYDVVITREPHVNDLMPLLSRPDAICLTATFDPCPSMPSADQIDAIVDQRLRNLSRVQLSGLDFSAGLHWPSDIGDWRVQLDGTVLLENRQELLPGAPKASELNNVWRPVDFRMRSSISWSLGALNAVAFVNYTDGYRDTRDVAYAGSAARPNVSSWTTVDLTLQYNLWEISKLARLKQAALTLSAINVLERDPPFVGSGIGVYYDGVNASPLGRFLSVQLTTRW